MATGNRPPIEEPEAFNLDAPGEGTVYISPPGETTAQVQLLSRCKATLDALRAAGFTVRIEHDDGAGFKAAVVANVKARMRLN